MPTLLERLRDALRPDYEVERELASGGMGVVFLARDVVLDRRVAVKVMRPELATARAGEQFLREARLLAKLSHPNAVPIHRAGEAEGLLYYVMDHIEGETLADRLDQGPLPAREVVKIGRDVLDALEAVHDLGIVHRDVKPENVFLLPDRALLGDFGIAVEAAPAPATAKPTGRPAGTPGYIAPEQWAAGTATPQTDIYAVGVTLTEAFTGQRWDVTGTTAEAVSRRAPRRYQRILRRAVQYDPSDRWPDAASFRRALWHTRRRAVGALVASVAVAGVLAGGAAVGVLRHGATPPRSHAAILPFAVRGGLDTSWGDDVARLAEASLAVLDYVPVNRTLRAAEAAGSDTAALLAHVNAGALVSGVVEPEGSNLRIVVVVTTDAGGSAEAPVLVRRDEVHTVGCQLASQIVNLVAPDRLDEFACNRALRGTRAEAVSEWLAGERAFFRQDWAGAERHYRDALAIDSGFALAKWRMVIARNWLRTGPGMDLDRLYVEEADRLPAVDHLLLDAMRTPLGPARYAKFEEAVDRFPNHTYPWLLYGDDLLHRGPLLGHPTDSAATVLAVATAIDSSLSPAYMQLAWTLIQLGRREPAARAVQRLLAIAVPTAVVPPEFFQLVYFERFAPDSAAPLRAALLGGGTWGPPAAMFLDRGLRWGLTFNVPRTQLDIAGAILAMADVPAPARARAFIAQGTALVRLGRIREALAAFDSVAALTGDPDSRLVRAQWPVMLSALGLMRGDDAALARARDTLATLANLPHATGIPTRAAWTLAIDGLARDDAAAFARWRDRLSPTDTGSTSLATVADAWRSARAGAYREALRLSDRLVGLVARDIPDPFLRAVLYLERGEWLALEGAREPQPWIWSQHSDADGWLDGPLQSAEVDWALATFAHHLLARHAARQGRVGPACRWYAGVVQWWSDADPELRASSREASVYRSERCPQ